jgi:hypothetical protein
MISQSETHLSVSWNASPTDGGCAVTGYRVYLENIASPGWQLVYNGVNQSTQTMLTLTAPEIEPSQYYLLKI